jgi:hypothetical protein
MHLLLGNYLVCNVGYSTDSEYNLIIGLTLGKFRISLFWNMTPCIPLKVNRRFRETSAPSSESKNKPNKKNGCKKLEHF